MLFNKALAALPEKPKSRDELIDVIIKAWNEGKNKRNDSRSSNVIAALYNANVLYVDE